MKLLGPIKREFLSLEDAEIDALYVGFMVKCARHMLQRAHVCCALVSRSRRPLRVMGMQSVDTAKAPGARSGWAAGPAREGTCPVHCS